LLNFGTINALQNQNTHTMTQEQIDQIRERLQKEFIFLSSIEEEDEEEENFEKDSDTIACDKYHAWKDDN
jgi:hypothetical protein